MNPQKENKEFFNAVKNHQSILVETILQENKIDPNDRDYLGVLPLFYAADVANPNRIGYSLSESAIDTIRVLMKNGANPDLTNNSGQTVLEIARELITAPTEYAQWLTLAGLLYEENSESYNRNISEAEKKQNLINPKVFEIPITETQFPILSKHTESKKETKTKNESSAGKLVAGILGLVFFLIPVFTFYFTWSDLFRLSSDWLWIDNLIVAATILISSLIVFQIFKEKKFLGYVFYFVPSVIACLLYFGAVISFFQPEVRFQIKKQFYMKSAFQSEPANYWVQEGFYEDFFSDEVGKKLRDDEELLIQLTSGLKLSESRSNIGLGFGSAEYIKQALVVYFSYREMNLSSKEIFSKPESIWLLYALAFAESNPDLAQMEALPKVVTEKFISVNKNSSFPLGILDHSNLNQLYEQVLKNISSANEFEVELAIYILTQIPVDLDDSSFEKVINRWIEFKPFYQKELSYLAELRKEMRARFQTIATNDRIVFVNLGYETNSSDWEIAKPFLASTGFQIEEGNSITINFKSTSEFLKDKKVYKTKPVQKSRTVYKQVPYYGSGLKYRTETRTETYTDYVQDGYDVVPTYLKEYSFPNFTNSKESVRLCGLLSDCYLNSKNETTLPYEVYSRGETWIYALPKKLICNKECN